MTRSLALVLEDMIAALKAGRAPQVMPDELPCFSKKALADQASLTPACLEAVLASLTEADVVTLEAARAALAEGTRAWLGFKVVLDPAAAVDSEDTDVVGIRGVGAGSADGEPGIFVTYEDRRIVFSRPISGRDEFQMLDATRGPHMHKEQYAGVAWLSLSLEHVGRVYIFGAGEVPLWTARYAQDVGFETTVIDDDAAYLTEERFPRSERILVPSFGELPDLPVQPRDYVLVLTRGHMHDPEAIVYGLRKQAHHVGMMGCQNKNERVFEMAKPQGITQEQLDQAKAPIGLQFGAKTPPELAMCIVAEMIQDRAELRKASAG